MVCGIGEEFKDCVVDVFEMWVGLVRMMVWWPMRTTMGWTGLLRGMREFGFMWEVGEFGFIGETGFIGEMRFIWELRFIWEPWFIGEVGEGSVPDTSLWRWR